MNKYEIEVVGFGREDDPAVLDMLTEVERDAVAEGANVRVNFRWGVEQLALVKEAARVQGLPYQVYIKKALYDRAAADLAGHFQLEAIRRGERERSSAS